MPAFSLGFFGTTLIMPGVFMACIDVDNMKGIGILFIIIGSIMLLSGIVWGIMRKAEKKETLNILAESNISDVDSMTGLEFENYLYSLFKKNDYGVQLTKNSGDYGVDLILTKKDNGILKKIIVQAKRYAKKVSISAIQEISAAKQYYGVCEAWVITNNYFTTPAINLAIANNVRLVDRNELAKIIVETKKLNETGVITDDGSRS